MCVIALCEGTRLTDQQVDQMWNGNPHGGGVCWRERDSDTGEVWVRWEKGIETVPEMRKLVAALPLPYVAHFRIPSAGPDIPEMCHPFEVSPTSSYELSGRTQNGVLFHNGTLSGWRAMLVDYAFKGGHKSPPGQWSDSRTMAWLAGCIGPLVWELPLFNEKVIVFGPKEIDVYGDLKLWSAIADGLWVSNTFWSYRMGSRQESQEVCNVHQKKGKSSESELDDPDWRKAQRQLPAQTVAEEVRPDHHPFIVALRRFADKGKGWKKPFKQERLRFDQALRNEAEARKAAQEARTTLH